MPRIYAPNTAHDCDWSSVPFIAGVAVVPSGEDTGFFTDAGYIVDDSKHTLEVWDDLTIAQLDALYAFLGGTVVGTDSKYQKVRKIETSLSVKYIGAVTAASTAATAGSGKTKITVTDPGTATYYLKTAATTSPDILYGDVPNDTWQALTLVTSVADEIEPNFDSDDKFTVVRVTADGVVDAIAKGNLTLSA